MCICSARSNVSDNGIKGYLLKGMNKSLLN